MLREGKGDLTMRVGSQEGEHRKVLNEVKFEEDLEEQIVILTRPWQGFAM